MVRINKFIYTILFLSILGCKNFQEQGLDDSHQLALPEPPEFGVPGKEYNKGMLFDFTGPINKFWVANDKLSISKEGDSLRVILKDCGQKYECWGTELDELMDLSKSPVLKVTARCEGAATMPTLGISLKDMDGYDTNMDRPSQRIRKSSTMEEYYFNYNNRWKQSWPDRKEVNPSAIAEILFFVNPGQANWTGTVVIDNIEIITLEEMPSEEEIKRKRREQRAKDEANKSTQNSPSTESGAESKTETEVKKEEVVSEEKSKNKSSKKAKVAAEDTKEASSAVTIDNFEGEVKGWWKSDDKKISISQDNGILVVSLDQVGPQIESFGKSFSKIDFTKTPVVKVRFKAEGNEVGDLRVDIKDVDGFSTNSKPNIKLFEIGTDFVDFYYDFTGKFEQNNPEVQRVNPSNIIEVILFVNPGGSAFTGKFYIDDISAITLDEFNKVK